MNAKDVTTDMTTTMTAADRVHDALPGPTDEPIGAKLIAEVTGMGYSTVTRWLRELEKAGRAEKIPPDDTRSTVLWFRPRPQDDPDAARAAQDRDAEDTWENDVARAHADLAGVPAAEMSDDEANEAFDGLPTSMIDDEDGDVARCRVCGCTENRACPGGCHWVPDPTGEGDLCSACLPAPVADDEDDAAPANDLYTRLSQPVDGEDGDPSPISPAPAGGDVSAIADWMGSNPPAQTGEVTPPPATDPLTEAQARDVTDRIRQHLTNLVPLITRAWTGRADLALGYATWQAYCLAELGGWRPPVTTRRAAAAQLRALGMSTRAIGDALGASEATVRRDLPAAPGDAPERTVVGLDRKQYPARKPAPADAPIEPPAPHAGEAVAPLDAHGGDGTDAREAPTGAASPVGAGDDLPAEGYKAIYDVANDPEPVAPAEVDGDGHVVIDGEATEDPTPPAEDRHDDPGPVPELPRLDIRVRNRIEIAMRDLDDDISDLAGLLVDQAGQHGAEWLQKLRDRRYQLDQIIRALEAIE